MKQVLVGPLEVLHDRYFVKIIKKKLNLVEPESDLIRESSFFIDLVVKALDSVSSGPGFETTGRLQVRLSLSSFWVRSNSWGLSGKK